MTHYCCFQRKITSEDIVIVVRLETPTSKRGDEAEQAGEDQREESLRRDQDLTQSNDVTHIHVRSYHYSRHFPIPIFKAKFARLHVRKSHSSDDAVWFFDELWLQKLQIEQTTQLIMYPFFFYVVPWRKQVDLYSIYSRSLHDKAIFTRIMYDQNMLYILYEVLNNVN